MMYIIKFDDGCINLVEGKSWTDAANSCLSTGHGKITAVYTTIIVDGGYMENEEVYCNE